MRYLMLMLCLLAGAVHAADVSVLPPTQMSCGSNYTTPTLTRVEVTLLNGTQPLGAAAINDVSNAAQGITPLRMPFASAATVNAMRLTCSYAVARGTLSHALTYNFKLLSWPVPAGDAAVVRVNIRGAVADGTRRIDVDGVEVFLPAPTNLRTVASVE